VAVALAVAVGVDVGVKLGVAVGLSVGLGVGVACATVRVDSPTGRPLNPSACPFVPAAPDTLHWYVPEAPLP
jgi:hypothetical protein